MSKATWFALAGVGAVVIIVVTGAAVGVNGWPGAPSGCLVAVDCSCEALSGGLVEQPVNTTSSLAFVAAGLLVLMVSARTVRTGLSLVFGASVMFLGVGSAVFHASVTEWGGWLDLLAIHGFLVLVLLIDVATLHARSDRWILVSLAAAVAALAPLWWWLDNGLGKYSLAVLIALIAVAEWRLRAIPHARAVRRLAWTVCLATTGLAFQWLGRGGGVWCDPDTVLQPHALWHVLAATATVTLHRYVLGNE